MTKSLRGANRMHGCELSPARYDQVVAALGGHANMSSAPPIFPRRSSALASGKPACVNVTIESAAAPALSLPL